MSLLVIEVGGEDLHGGKTDTITESDVYLINVSILVQEIETLMANAPAKSTTNLGYLRGEALWPN